MKFYAGIGSRETPTKVLDQMAQLASDLQLAGYALCSGAAHGADSAFENGAGEKKRIYLPWDGYNNRWVDGRFLAIGVNPTLERIASEFHPAWDHLSQGVRKLHTRNIAIVTGMGNGRAPVEFVVCWTVDGAGGGGTGQALRYARSLGIPIYDLALGTVKVTPEGTVEFHAF